MAVLIGSQSKIGARIESDLGLASALYPTTEATADDEEVKVKTYDLVPAVSESISDNHEWENDESIIGKAGIVGSDRVSREPGGSLSLKGKYDGLDVFFACALGGEDWSSPDWTVGTQKTEVDCAVNAAGLVGTMNALDILAGDDDKWIKFDTSGTSDTNEGQVRHIASVDAVANTVTWANEVTQMSTDLQGIVIAEEFTHTFEPTNNLHDQLWTDVYSDYPTAGVGTSSDLLIRRFTLGVAKAVSLHVWRSVMVNSLKISGSAKSGVNIEADLVPFDRVTDSLGALRQDGTTVAGWKTNLKWNPSALFSPDTNENIMFSDLTFRIDDYSTSVALTSADNYGISAFEINIANNLKTDDHDSVSGEYRKQPVRNSQRLITGSFTLPRYTADDFIDYHANDTVLMAHFNFVGSTMTTITRAFQIWIPSLKITGHKEQVAGPGIVNEVISWQAYIPAGQAMSFPAYGITDPNPDIQIQTTNRNAFSMFRDQCAEY